MLSVIDTFGEELPAACQSTCQEAWSIFDQFLTKYGSDYQMCERATRVLRLGINFFGNAALPMLPSVLSRMSAAFEATGHSSYMWIAGKCIGRFGDNGDVALRTSFKEVYERCSNKLVQLLHDKTPGQIPDGKSQ